MGKKGYGSCFGYDYQQYTKYIIKYVERHFNSKDIKILIPNALDGLNVLATARRGFKLDCYESQNEFINGGNIDKFNIIGLKEKINYFNLNDKINIIEGSEGEKVLSLNDTENGINLALPKSEFAERVLQTKEPFDKFDFNAFLELFKILKKILDLPLK